MELAKDWRTDKMLRQLEALLIVADQDQTFLLSGHGDVIEPDERHCRHRQRRPVCYGAATALMENTHLARERSPKSL